MRLLRTELPGCFEIEIDTFTDHRGRFAKNFQREKFQELGLEFAAAEEYFTFSLGRVLRGLHFQVPPRAHDKIVTCVSGRVLDILLDIRVGSPSYGRCHRTVLDGNSMRSLFVAAGVAHGFYSFEGGATMFYATSTSYAPEFDRGVHWRSVANEWPDATPIVSERDEAFPVATDFESPFRFQT
jgi:dTDP-4-dehydrorhamnose 3,5-epimerase